MKNIHYAGEVLMTGDAIADAVVQYAETLAKHGTSASIGIPVVTDSGVTTEANFLLGPASQLVAVTMDSDFADPQDDELIARMTAEKSKLDGVEIRSASGVEPDPPDYDLRFDLGDPAL
jgi:hypothetical protein